MDGAEQECSGYDGGMGYGLKPILRLGGRRGRAGMLGLRWWDGARAEAHGTVGGALEGEGGAEVAS